MSMKKKKLRHQKDHEAELKELDDPWEGDDESPMIMMASRPMRGCRSIREGSRIRFSRYKQGGIA